MNSSRMNEFDKAVRMRKESADALLDYWVQHSIYSSFEFWILVALFLCSLILLAIKIDKSKLFQVGFFGFSVHILSVYTNVIGINLGVWNYPIQMFPFLPAFSFDASIVPVSFMLVYQWTFNNKKNYYLYAIMTSGIFSIIIDPILVQIGILKLYGTTNYIHRLVCFVIISFSAKFLTNLFIKFHKKPTSS